MFNLLSQYVNVNFSINTINLLENLHATAKFRPYIGRSQYNNCAKRAQTKQSIVTTKIFVIFFKI